MKYDLEAVRQAVQVQNEQANDWDNVLLTWYENVQISEKSKETYQAVMKKFFGWMEQQGISSPTPFDLSHYKDSLKDQELGTATINTHVSALKSFFKWTNAMRIYPDMAVMLKNEKTVRSHKREPLTIDQAKELLSSIDDTTEKGARDKAIILLSLITGLRSQSIYLADIADLTQTAGVRILRIQAKGHTEKDDFVKIPPILDKAIRHYLSFRISKGKHDPLFTGTGKRQNRLSTQSIRKMFKARLREIGIDDEKISFHSLRHSSSFNLIQQGADLKEIQSMLGHQNITTTMIYADHANKLQRTTEEMNARIFEA